MGALELLQNTSTFAKVELAFLIFLLYYLGSVIYNLYLHPLSKYLRPFLAKLSDWPFFYHTLRGDRHIWLWQLSQLYGPIFRCRPNHVVLNTPSAYCTIYDAKANVKKARFYEAWMRRMNATNTWNLTDKGKHARRRRVLNAAFSDKATRSAERFVTQHVDRWCELLAGDGTGTKWSEARNMTHWSDYFLLNVLGELCFGRSLGMKELADSGMKFLPQRMLGFLTFLQRVAHSPFLPLWVWLKPRGLDRLLEITMPKDFRLYRGFVDSCLDQRCKEEEEIQADVEMAEAARKDMFHYIFQSKDPETGGPGYSRDELYSESDLLITASSDTTSTTFAAMFFYLIRNPRAYDRLASEIRSTFTSADEIRAGKPLSSCRYLHCVIDETMRMNPPVSGDLPREVPSGGLTIDGHFFAAGTNVSSAHYALFHDPEFFPDPFSFKLERWIVDEEKGVSAASVELARSAFNPFSLGPRGCSGKNLAYLEMTVAMAKVLYRLDFRGLEGDALGGGGPDMMWGRRGRGQFQTKDVFVAIRDGPNVQFRSRLE